MTKSVVDQLSAAASATFTESAADAIGLGVQEIHRLEAEVAMWRAMYECAWHLASCERIGRMSAECRAKSMETPTEGSHGQGE